MIFLIIQYIFKNLPAQTSDVHLHTVAQVWRQQTMLSVLTIVM